MNRVCQETSQLPTSRDVQAYGKMTKIKNLANLSKIVRQSRYRDIARVASGLARFFDNNGKE